MKEKDALSLAIEIVEKGNCSDYSLEVTHINRGYRFIKISSHIFHLSIERHPHIVGLAVSAINWINYSACLKHVLSPSLCDHHLDYMLASLPVVAFSSSAMYCSVFPRSLCTNNSPTFGAIPPGR